MQLVNGPALTVLELRWPPVVPWSHHASPEGAHQYELQLPVPTLIGQVMRDQHHTRHMLEISIELKKELVKPRLMVDVCNEDN